MKGDEMVMLSHTGNTNEQLVIQWLKQFIKYTRAEPFDKCNLLLKAGHKSHVTPKFTLLALEHHI